MRVTSDDDVIVVNVTVAQGPPGPPGPQGPPGEGGGGGIPQGGPLTEDLYTGGFAIAGSPDIVMQGAHGLAGSGGGSIYFEGGVGNGMGGGGFLRASGGTSDGGGGLASMVGGDAGGASDVSGGDVVLKAGAGNGTGRGGLVIIETLPTADPGVADALWNDAGTLKVSAG